MSRQIYIRFRSLAALVLLLLGSATMFVACPGVPQTENTTEQPTAEQSGDASGVADVTRPDTSAPDTATADATKQDTGNCTPAEEVCNGKDDDCDGDIDEGLTCPKEGETRPCYTGPAATKDKGTCQSGKQAYQSGQWGKCEGEVTPGKETCDGKDNDCDGDVDEEVTKACKTVCGAGQQSCSNGKWSDCDAPKPEKEVCDGKDNDCNGETDEGCKCNPGDTQPCGTKGGICKQGKQTCDANGKWGKCLGAVGPESENCNGKDDDCDGSVDEGLQTACYTGPANTGGVGACKQGKQLCTAGKWGKCQGEVLPTKETCDGQDNDCNGKNDDLPALTCGKGPCANKVPACANGAPNTCKPKPPGKEVCNGKDDDCDGNVDDGATCPSGQKCSNGKCQGGGTPAYRSGSFKSPGNYRVVGTASFYKTSSGERIEFSANFSTSAGPDLYVYLVKVTGGAASDSPKNYISLGKVKSFTGAQTYTLGQSSAGYKSIVIWCKRFGVNFGYADIKP